MNNVKQLLISYIEQIQFIRQTKYATNERSYYPALTPLLDAFGAEADPRVRSLHDSGDVRGVGHPDFTLIVEANNEPRAAIEVKGAEAEINQVIASEQVARYLEGYNLVLVTTLREFALVQAGQGVVARYTLAADAEAFWTSRPQALAAEHESGFADFLRLVIDREVQIKRPKDLAGVLARFAREALRRLESKPAEELTPLREALGKALGLAFADEQGEHFFRSSLVQTLFYGLFSGWVAYHRLPKSKRGKALAAFEWRDAGTYLNLPLVTELYEEIAQPSQLKRLDLRQPMEWAASALNRSPWEQMEAAFGTGDAINYFYEPFLEAFDPDLRRDLGVWYTPPEIVKYMVNRVDTALREELGLADGLANPNVYVLDPCCGTGAYLLETLNKIAETLKARGEEGLIGADLQVAAQKRVFGFEILPAPFIVAQMQIGTLLNSYGVTMGEKRASVFLTNALTRWERYGQLNLDGFPELEREVEAADTVKQGQNILVVMGNPPYSGFAGTAMEEESNLVGIYRTTQRAPRPQGQGLNDLYVRFYAMADKRIVERTGKESCLFISNYSWLDGLSHTGMRERYLDQFDKIWVDNLNGDKYRTGKVTPEGKPDPSVFSTATNREGIQVGTAITTLVRKVEHKPAESVHYRSLWGVDKREQLSTSAEYEVVRPVVEIGLPFAPGKLGADYLTWPKLTDLFPKSFPGVTTSRDPVVVDIDRDRLVKRMEQYFDPKISNEQMALIAPAAMRDSGRFNANGVRNHLIQRGLLNENFVRYCYRPFDVRWLYWEPETKLLDEKRADYFPHVFKDNIWLTATQQNRRNYDPPIVTTSLGSYHLVERGANLFPLFLNPNTSMPSDILGSSVNTSPKATVYLTAKNVTPAVLFFHAIATMHTPAYRAENAGALRQDWPRIPLPGDREVLLASAALGKQIAALLDPETDVPGVSSGTIREELRGIGVASRVGGGNLNPQSDFEVRAGWGYLNQGATMPGQGRSIVREVAAGEDAGLGDKTVDVYLNDTAYWRNVPQRVWEYTVGGYQVMKKWLSYREYPLLGRALKLEEVREVSNMARRIAAILLLESALDESYARVKDQVWTLASPLQ